MTRTTIASEITGKVWKIEAAAGTKLAEDDPIVILESMKMEIPVASEVAARVEQILVAEGDPVQEGQQVATLAT
jgi:acetyl-CoA carboxylase biotin carboxyl carrier protein